MDATKQESPENTPAPELKTEQFTSPSGTDHSEDEGAPLPQSEDALPQFEDAKPERKSVKYLTCYYWKAGGCKKSEEECLYSHHDTGMYANQPRPARPGVKGPMVAGRNARRYNSQNRDSGGHSRGYQGQNAANAFTGPYAFVPHSVEKLHISSPTGGSPNTNMATMDQPNIHLQEQPLPPITTTIPSTHERRLTVGAGRPSSSPQDPSWSSTGWATPKPSDRVFSGRTYVGSPSTSSPHYQSAATASPDDTGESLYTAVQTTRVARQLDQSLCEVMRGLVDVSKAVYSAQRGEATGGGGGLQGVQKRVSEMYAEATKGREGAKALAQDGVNYGEIFVENVVS